MLLKKLVKDIKNEKAGTYFGLRSYIFEHLISGSYILYDWRKNMEAYYISYFLVLGLPIVIMMTIVAVDVIKREGKESLGKKLMKRFFP